MSAFPWSLPRLTARSLRRWAACCGLLLACAPSARPPAAAAGGTLSPNGEAGENGKPGPFRVVFSGPQGEVAGGAQLSLVFSRPLRALSVAGEEAAPPIRLEPAIEGSFRYVGTHALIFQPKAGHLPNATAVRVTVPAELRALDGSTLGQAHVFEFSTPRPRIASSTPGDGANGLGPSTSFELELNQLVSRQELAKQLVLRAAGGKSGRPLAYDLRWPDQKFPKRVVVVPRAPLPAATPIELVLSAATVGQEGPLSAGADQTLTFHTYDRLAVSEIECARSSPRSPCMPHSGVWLTLTNPVKMRDLKKSVKIEPALPISWDSWRDDDDETAYIDLNAPFAPGKSYTIRVLAGLTDVFGQKLQQDHALRLEIGDFDPRVALGVEGEYFEPTARPAIPVASVNVGSYSLWTHPLELAQVERLFADPVGEESAVRSLLSGVRERKIQPSAARNQPHQETLPVADVLPAGRGPLLMAARYEARGGTEQIHRIVQVTDLAISAKLSAHGRSVVWVTALSTGKPLGDAEVRLSGTGAAGSEKWIKTNADGLAELPADALAPVRKRPERALIVVRRGKDWAYRSVGEGFSPWRLDVPADPLGEPREYGMLFSERGLYRPGDSVEVKGILRREGGSGNELLSERDFVLELRSPNWEVLETRAVHTTSFGTFAAKLRVPASARLGNYRVTVRPPGDPEDRYGGGLASTSFELAEYRPNEFSASAASASPSYRHGDEARFSLSADYLYGAPMSGASFNYRLTRMETYFAVPGAEAFVTGNHAYDSAYPERAPSSGLIDSGDGKLDGKGTFERKLPLSLPGQRSPELISFDAEVVDLSRQAIGTSSSVVVHPADHYVGIEPPESYLLPTAQPVSLRALLLSPEGQHLTGRAIELTLYRRKYGVVRETSAGQSHTETRLIETRVGSCKVQSERDPRGCPLTPVDPGYYVVVAEARDAKGRSARAAVDFYALGSGGDSGFWPEDDSARLELVANKKQYAPGDVARVLVKSPFPSAEALITVEADGVKSERRLTLVGPTPSIEVPITDAMRPNAYVGVHLVRARSKPAPEGGQVDLGAPTFRTGYVDLPINPELRRLAVELRPNRTDYRPGEEITVDLGVKAGNQGVTSEVTVYAVDEGVLSLIGYRTPDPIPVFTAARPLRTTLLEAREDLARLSRDPRELLGLGPNKGAEGGGGGDEAGARRDFRQSAYFNPAVLTDGSGKATVRFRLPDSLTTYRLMAVATTTDDRYGYAERRVTSSKPLMARPALPRLFRAGDHAEAGLIVSAKEFGPARVEITMKVQGLGAQPTEEHRTVELPRNGSTEVRFPLEAALVGTARFEFDTRASSATGPAQDKVIVERRVASPAQLEAVAMYGETQAAVAEKLGDLSSIRRDVGSLELRATSSALVGLDGGFDQLLEYPYGCTEQITSRLLPLLPLGELARAYAVKLPTDTKPLVEKGLADLLARQRGDGGFGMWPESRESSDWVTPYALFAVWEAKNRGFTVADSVLDMGSAYLRRQLSQAREGTTLAASTFALHVLTLLGNYDPGYATKLFEARKQLPVFSRALLLHSLAQGHPGSEEAKTLARELENQLHIEANRAAVVENLGDDYAALMDSPARSTAIVLRALLAHDPKHTLAAPLVRGLLSARHDGSWRSTQETSFALLALDAYQKAREATPPSFSARFWQGDRSLLTANFQGKGARTVERSLSLAELGSEPIVFEKLGSGTLFYEARLRYARKELPREGLDRGFFVQKGLREVTAEELGSGTLALSESHSTQLKAGSMVLVDLVIVSPEPRDYVVIDDPLPAGLEAVDSSFETSAAWTQISGSTASWDADEQAHGTAFQYSWYRRELRDDRVLFFVDHLPAGMYHYRYLARATTLGTFVEPPTRAEEMYSPEVFGRNGARTLEIR